jgi:alkaline phosphatase D
MLVASGHGPSLQHTTDYLILAKMKTFYILFIGLGFTPLLSQKTTIAFGSCGHQDNALKIFDVVVKHQPDLFIFLGDNIYGDTKVMDTLKAKYGRLAAKPGFQNLKKNTKIIATWDDHDYGWNDVGRHYKYKKESKEIFLDFWEEPKDSPRRKHEGIYTSYIYEYNEKKLQVILLDNRTFRDDLKKYKNEFASDKRYFYELDYAPYTANETDSTFLGEQQWKWLENELKQPADLRLIGSGSQFGIEFNGYEAWANFPHEQKRFLDLIKSTKANGILFLSGDVHYAEISKLVVPDLYPIYDVTSSGLSSTWHFATPNKNRIEGPVMENHFGLLTIDWGKEVPTITMEIWDMNDNQRIEYTIGLNEISF